MRSSTVGVIPKQGPTGQQAPIFRDFFSLTTSKVVGRF